LGSSSPCTNYFHVFFSSSVLSREMARVCNGGKGLKNEFWLKLIMWLQNIGAKGEY
jgi:hypothetical protein